LTDPDESVPSADLYLAVAASVVDTTVREWLDPAGDVVDPFESTDRWQGGTSARFACPAAILARLRNRVDLIQPAADALDQLCRRIAVAADEHEPPFIPGVLDLTAKEIMVARNMLAALVPAERLQSWDAALSAYSADESYTFRARQRRGERPHNYEAYASVGEWLRCQAGLARTGDWIAEVTRANLEWTTEHGLYRDPNDPATYDLSVRQNWSELLAWGYEGDAARELNDLLERGGLTTLRMVSPLGWAPFGGRSNLFVHNEGMVAYICESEARRWHARGQHERAASFRRVAHAAAHVARAHYAGPGPLRSIKNAFAPSTRHGRDTHYGEYAVYSLLGASLFARAALVADDAIDRDPGESSSAASLLHLYPAFHRTFATCGDTQVQLDTRAQLAHDATGIGRIHRVGVPPALGMSCSIAADAAYIIHRGTGGRALALGPTWQRRGGPWLSLAGCSDEILDVTCECEYVGDDEVRWTIAQELKGLDVERIVQHYSLSSGRLQIRAALHGNADRVAMEVPCLSFDGQAESTIHTGADGVTVEFQGASLTARTPQAEHVRVSDTEHASRQAVYRVTTLERRGQSIGVEIQLDGYGQ